MIIKEFEIGHDNQCIAKQCGDIAFAKAKFIILLGANGVGKTTLINAITTGNHLLHGTASIEDRNIRELSDLQRAKQIAILTSKRDFSFFLTVRELLELSRAPYTNFLGKLTKDDHSIIEEILTFLQLEKLSNRPLNTLSDGQLQRAIIGRVLVQDTPYIFMDEPSSYLDIHHRAQLLDQLKIWCKKKEKTIILSTHQIEIGLKLCDDVLYIHDKKIAMCCKETFIDNNYIAELFPSPLLNYENGNIKFSPSSTE